MDLQKTLRLFREALKFTTQLGAEGKTVLFIGTKRQAQEVIAEEARRAGMFFVNQRWLGGILTNFVTIQKSIARFRDLTAMAEDGKFDELSKKEVSRLDKERRRLEKNLSGIQDMKKLPDAIFVVDARREDIAVHEAKKLGIPVIGIVDTNCDPDTVDFVIPGNDDALRAIKLFTSRVADALIAGRGLAGVDDAPTNGSGASTEAKPPEAAEATAAPGAEAATETPAPAEAPPAAAAPPEAPPKPAPEA